MEKNNLADNYFIGTQPPQVWDLLRRAAFPTRKDIMKRFNVESGRDWPTHGDDWIENQLEYPPALAKACTDDFSYALKLKNGDEFRFSQARPIDKTWVRIDGLIVPEGDTTVFPRGLEIRVDQIAWVCDAPEGS